MYVTVRGLVLRVTPYKETDAFVTLLTTDRGRLTVKARGLRRKNSPLIAPCQLLVFGEYTLFEYRDMFTIQEASTIELFLNLRNDLLKLALGTYFAKVANVISQEDMPSPELLSLVLNCLFALTKLPIPLSQIKAVFELRCACIAGYMPYLESCHRCGEPYPDRFDISEGRLECTKCRGFDADTIRLPVYGGMLECMRYICNCDEKKLFSFSANQETLDALSGVTESYLTTQLERGFSSLDFYKSLLN